MARILLIEDDPLIYRLYSRVLTREGHELELADNGLAGLELLPVFKPDIILLDIMMPTMDGLEFLGKLKADPEVQDTPVVVVTNVADKAVADQAMAKGAAAWLVKSDTEPEELLATIKRLLA